VPSALLFWPLHRLIPVIILSDEIRVSAFSKKASRSARLNLHGPPMMRPSISPRFTHSRTVRGLRRSTFDVSRSVSRRSPMRAAAFFCFLFAVIQDS